MDVTIPTMDRTDQSVHPWPYFLLFNGATVTITGKTSGAFCTLNAQVVAGTITWDTPNCTDSPTYVVHCTGNNCFLPWNDF